MPKSKPSKKAENPPAPPSGPESPTRGRGRPKSANPKPVNPIILTVRARPEYEEWLDETAKVLGQSVGVGKVDRAFLFDRAIRDLAKTLGRPDPPERF